MDELFSQRQIVINDKVYVKDPNSSELGHKIVQEATVMIEEMGLENFTFSKLAKRLKTTESTIYRYFENKQRLLIYLISWYWGWIEYRIVFKTSNITCPEERLKIAIQIISKSYDEGEVVNKMDVHKLSNILISESAKAYLTKEVDEVNKEGFYASYKRLVARVASMVQEVRSDFSHPHSLISTIIEGVFHQKYFALHIPSLTDFRADSNDLADFYYALALNTIHQKNTSNK